MTKQDDAADALRHAFVRQWSSGIVSKKLQERIDSGHAGFSKEIRQPATIDDIHDFLSLYQGKAAEANHLSYQILAHMQGHMPQDVLEDWMRVNPKIDNNKPNVL